MEDQIQCRELLASHGYSFLTNFADTLAYREKTPNTAYPRADTERA